MKRLAIITTHPIQYNAPLFRLLSDRGNINIKVFYTWSQSAEGAIFDPGFGINKSWDIPLLEGYDYQFSENVSKTPGSHHFNGVINPSLIDDIASYEPDAVLVYGWSFKSHLRVLRYFKNRIPVIFRGDSTLINEKPGFSIKKIFRRLTLTWVYRHIDQALYVGELNKQYFLAHGVKESRLTFMPHAVDNKRFSTGEPLQMESLRTKLGIDEGAIVFLYAGKFEPVKNPVLLIRAFKKISRKDIHLVMVGSGEMEAMLKEAVAGSGNIHFLPFQNQSAIPSVYAIADVFVLPSVSETWGLAVNEAMAAGKAILLSNKCGCHVDLVKPGENGYVFQSNNLKDLVEKIDLLVQKDKAGLKALGEKSRHIIEDWSYVRAAAGLENAINRIAR